MLRQTQTRCSVTLSDRMAVHPQDRLEELLNRPVAATHEALAVLLDVLQRLGTDDGDPLRADRCFQRLLLIAFHGDASLLVRLLDEPERSRQLSAGSQRALTCLRHLRASDIAAAVAMLAALTASDATAAERVVASRLLLRSGRMAEALDQLRRCIGDPACPTASREAGALSALLLRRALPAAPVAAAPPRVYLTLCTALRNEATHLSEWIAYHAALGVERFCLYENQSSDDTPAMLERLRRHYDIEIVPWLRQPANVMAFDDFLETRGETTEWVACIDADEFLVPTHDTDLRILLRRVPDDVAAVTANWRIFGSSGHRRRPKGLGLANYQRRARDDFAPNCHVKSIVRPARAFLAVTSHQFLGVGRQLSAGLEEVFPLAGQVVPPRYQELSLHHYIIRSREDFDVKRARGRPEMPLEGRRWHHDNYFEEFDRNEVRDRSVERFLPALRRRLAELD